MGFSNQERINMLVKAFFSNVLDADATAAWYETFPSYSMIIDGSNAWTELSSVPAAGTIAAARSNATANPTLIEDLSQNSDAVRLTLVGGTNDSTYIAYSTYGNTSSAVLTNWLVPQLVPQSSGAPSNGYSVQLYDGDPAGGGTLVTTTAGSTGAGENKTVGWIWNYARGMLLISADFSVSDPYIVGFRYTGRTAQDGGTSAQRVQTNSLVASEAIAIGEVVRLTVTGEGTEGRGKKASASSAGSEDVYAAVTAAAGAASTFDAALVGEVPLKFSSPPASTDNGKAVYLSSSAGIATLAVPGSGTVIRLGTLKGGNGSSSTPSVLFRPQVLVTL